MQPFVPHLAVHSSSLGPRLIQVAVALPDGFRLAAPSGPNHNGTRQPGDPWRRIDLPVQADPQARHGAPSLCQIAVAPAEQDPGPEIGAIVTLSLPGSDSARPTYVSCIRYDQPAPPAKPVDPAKAAVPRPSS